MSDNTTPNERFVEILAEVKGLPKKDIQIWYQDILTAMNRVAQEKDAEIRALMKEMKRNINDHVAEVKLHMNQMNDVKSKLSVCQNDLARLKQYDGNDEHPENRCQRCKGRNLHNWYADNDVWNKVAGDKFGVVCPNCFVELAKEVGIKTSAWRLSMEGDLTELDKLREQLHEALAPQPKQEGIDLSQQLQAARQEVERLKELLTEISEGKGRYNHDKLKHASNTIEDMIELAKSGLDKKGEGE